MEVAVVATEMVTSQPRSASSRPSKGRSPVLKTNRAGNADHGGRTPREGHALNASQRVGEINMETPRRKIAEAAEADVKHDLRIQEILEGTFRHQRR